MLFQYGDLAEQWKKNVSNRNSKLFFSEIEEGTGGGVKKKKKVEELKF